MQDQEIKVIDVAFYFDQRLFRRAYQLRFTDGRWALFANRFEIVVEVAEADEKSRGLGINQRN